MLSIIEFYDKEMLNNGGLQNLLNELTDSGFDYNNSFEAIKKHFNLKETTTTT